MNKRNGMLAGAIALMLLAGAAPVAGYHIDNTWVPVNAATGVNTNCPHPSVGGGPTQPGATPDAPPGWQCNNSPARGWVVNINPTVTICEQNRQGLVLGTPGGNGMCTAHNQDADLVDNLYTEFDPTDDAGYGQTPGTGNADKVGSGTVSSGTRAELDMDDWTRFYIFADNHPDFGDTDPANSKKPTDPLYAGGCMAYQRLNPHGTGSRVNGTGVQVQQDPACIPGKGNIFAQVRVGSNAHGMLLTPSDAPYDKAGGVDGARCDVNAYPEYGDMFGGWDATENPETRASPGRCDPRDYGPSQTFYYRELLAYWSAGGHVTFFVHATPSIDKGGEFTEGSYWAASIEGSPATDNNDRLAVECNMVFDDRIQHHYLRSGVPPAGVVPPPTPDTYHERALMVAPPGTSSYFNIFEPVTYVAEGDVPVFGGGEFGDARTTVCRGNHDNGGWFIVHRPGIWPASEDGT